MVWREVLSSGLLEDVCFCGKGGLGLKSLGVGGVWLGKGEVNGLRCMLGVDNLFMGGVSSGGVCWVRLLYLLRRLGGSFGNIVGII